MPPLPASALASTSPIASAAVSSHTYKWAEMIVRAHKKCSPGMLERLLQVDATTASALKSQLLEKGVISAQANSFGIHSAVKPLYEGAFMKPSSQLSNGLKKANETLDKMMVEETSDNDNNEEALPENESEISNLEETLESDEEVDIAQEPKLPA
jgi:hypothetical protein